MSEVLHNIQQAERRQADALCMLQANKASNMVRAAHRIQLWPHTTAAFKSTDNDCPRAIQNTMPNGCANSELVTAR